MALEVNGFVVARRTRAIASILAYYLRMEVDNKATLKTISIALVALPEGHTDAADKLSRELLRALPRDPAAHQLAAVVALQRKNYDEAEAFSRSCLALRPDHVPALKIAGCAAFAGGDWAGSKGWFRRLSEIVIDEAEPVFQLCLAQIESGDLEAQTTVTALAVSERRCGVARRRGRVDARETA
jgi:predicted Zn-dependent protease